MADRVVRVERCELRVAGDAWSYAQDNAAAIEAHWLRRSRENARLFNGGIFVMRAMSICDGALRARFSATDFKSYLHWRESGFPESGARDGFGSALIRSREGHVLLGRQSPGNLNAGLAYLPGGFIDARDVAADGSIDIAGSIARELAEETGLDVALFERVPGFLVTSCGPLVSIAVELRSALDAQTLREAMLDGMARGGDSELAEAVVIRAARDADAALVPPYARALLRFVLDA